MAQVSAGVQKLFYELGFFVRTLRGVAYFVKRWNVSANTIGVNYRYCYSSSTSKLCT
jgi:hypothetical protein